MQWSLTKGAQEFGVEPKTLRAALIRNGITVSRGQRYSTLQLASALYDDFKRERTLEVRERRKLLEKENAEKDGSLVHIDEAKKVITQVLAPVRSKLIALSTTLANRCNPLDPELARKEIEEAVQYVLQGT